MQLYNYAKVSQLAQQRVSIASLLDMFFYCFHSIFWLLSDVHVQNVTCEHEDRKPSSVTAHAVTRAAATVSAVKVAPLKNSVVIILLQ